MIDVFPIRLRRDFCLHWRVIAAAVVLTQFWVVPVCRADSSGVPQQLLVVPHGVAPVTGQMVFWRISKIATPVMGRIAALPFRVGDRVKKGEVVAEIDTEQLRSLLAVTQSELENARAQLGVAKAHLASQTAIRDRQEKLKQSAAFLPSRLEDADKLVAVAQASIEAANTLISVKQAEVARQEVDVRLATIRAPFDGIVISQLLTVGGLTSDHEPHMLVMVDDSAPEIEIVVPVEFAAKTEIGQEMVYSAAKGQFSQAKVRAVLPSIIPDAKTRIVRLVPEIPSGQKAFSDAQPVTVYLPKN